MLYLRLQCEVAFITDGIECDDCAGLYFTSRLVNRPLLSERYFVKHNEVEEHYLCSTRGILAGYGMVKDDWYKLLRKQNYGCALCHKLPNERRFLHIDHDHWLERNYGIIFVRGLLCASCNNNLRYDKEHLYTGAKREYLDNPPGGFYGVNLIKAKELGLMF